VDKKYLVVKGKAGMGNRMLVLLDSILFAQLTGRELLVDWRDGKYGPLGDNAFPMLFEAPAAGDIGAIKGCDSVTPAVWKGHLDESVDELFAQHFPDHPEMDGVPKVMQRYTISVRVVNHAEKVAVRWGWTHQLPEMRKRFSGELASFREMPEDVILRRMLRGRVKLAADLRAKVDAFKAEHFQQKAIGVHVRYSDRVNAYDVCFKHVAAFLREHPGAAVFLATDNHKVEADFRKRFPRVVATAKWFPPAGVPIHRNDLPDRRPLDNAREALIDLYLLGECDALVFNSTSTFSILAKLLSDAPQRWLIDTAPVIKPLLRKGLRQMRSARERIYEAVGLRRLFGYGAAAKIAETLPEGICHLL
jgi:hypothetical protein